MKTRKQKRGEPCSVTWCACLVAHKDGTLCAVHLKNRDLHPAFVDPEMLSFAANPSDCRECGGSGECESCNGDGDHYCGHCSDVHECGACDGTGACRKCRPQLGQKLESYDERYLRWALDINPLKPIPALDWPWEDAA